MQPSFLRSVHHHTVEQHSLLSFYLDNPSQLTATNQAHFTITTIQQAYSSYLPRLLNLSTTQWQDRSNSKKSVYKNHVFNQRFSQRPYQEEGTSARTSSSITRALATCYNKDSPAATLRYNRQLWTSGKASLSRYINNEPPAPILQGVICHSTTQNQQNCRG